MSEQQTPLILASASPRRRELLERFGLPFIVEASLVDEEADPALSPQELVLTLARRKAFDVAERREGLILAADTVVVIDNHVLGKPVDAGEARMMLRSLSGRCHRVLTGMALYSALDQHLEEAVEQTDVWFKVLEDAEIERYLQCGEYLDKAGSYAAQGRAAAFIERIEGCYHNVIGLPLFRLNQMLQAFDRRLV